MGLAVLVLGAVTTTRWADRTARTTASLFRDTRVGYEPAPAGRGQGVAL
jgi:hypothetical protein